MESSLQVQDIWKDGEFSQWLLSSFNQKSFQELIFKAAKNCKHSGYVDLGRIDWPKSVFLQTEATHFETMITTVDEVNSDKTKVGIYFL